MVGVPIADPTALPIDIHFIYGADSDIEKTTYRHKVQSDLEIKNINCTVTVLDGAGHHPMTERPTEVNELVNRILISSK